MMKGSTPVFLVRAKAEGENAAVDIESIPDLSSPTEFRRVVASVALSGRGRVKLSGNE
jgi:hypothetical protein